ncbi:MAG: ABC transporter ATP-binding protein [Bacteroidetes bacterium]|nr:MAG: ABC transporter ATP-binding protein [Bacteroidota bacterium]
MKPILEIQNISKKYRIRGQESPYLTLRDSIMSFGKKSLKISKDEFWALKDINFNVYPGESIGIIGRNGAGKSTLLKILSRITPPTEGRIISRGRVASLLEVGTGFHAELTGRENIFLNGSILGLRKEEINKKFDEIVDFSGVEKFLDTPLKHYSSGMQLRLAFAVAAHLEPEILVIDEVLSVGDAAFQKKSLGKMEEVTKQGRTVLFVSHNMAAVQNLCSKGVLLELGRQLTLGKIDDVINRYSLNNRTSKGDQIINLRSLQRSGPNSEMFNLTRLLIKNDKLYEGQPIKFEIEFEILAPQKELLIGFSITSLQNILLIENRSTATYNKLNLNKIGNYKIECECQLFLKSGVYNLNLGARAYNGLLDYIPSSTILEILPSKGNKNWNNWNKPNNGLFIIESKWNLINYE